MSCTRICFDPASPHFGHEDCHTCPGRDAAPSVDWEQEASVIWARARYMPEPPAPDPQAVNAADVAQRNKP